jgi:O-antigen ligase
MAALVVLATLVASATVGLRRLSSRHLVLLGGGVGLLLLVQEPALGLIAMTALSFTLPLEIGTGTEVALTPPVFLVPALAAAWFLNGMWNRSLRLPKSRTTLPLLLFVGSGLLSLAAGTAYWDPLVPRATNLVLVQLAQWAIFALSAAIFWLTSDLGARGRWLQVATFTFLVLGSVVVVSWYVHPLWSILDWARLANGGMFWAWLAALATGQLMFNRKLGTAVRLWLLALLLAAAYVVWFQMSEWVSGWGPFMAAVLTVVWLWLWKRNRMAGLAIALLLIALPVLLYPVFFEHAGGQAEFQTSWGGRQVLYKAVLDLVKEHPVLGLGPAAYRHYAFTHQLSLGTGRALYLRPNVSSHNNYIDIYAQMGLLGVGWFLWFLTEVALVGWRLVPRFQGGFAEGYVCGALGGLVGTLVAMMLVDWFLPYVYNVGFRGFRTSALAWMFLGGLVALEQRSRGAGTGERRGEGEEESG